MGMFSAKLYSLSFCSSQPTHQPMFESWAVAQPVLPYSVQLAPCSSLQMSRTWAWMAGGNGNRSPARRARNCACSTALMVKGPFSQN
ncbi:hypothetical protein D3C80_1782410 [compost metagenome]